MSALSLLDDIINQIMISGLDLDDRAKQIDFISNNIRIPGKFVDFDCDKICSFVNDKLIDISKEYNCKILYCAERSSHVWGTSHCKSDNDIKAIIYYKARDYYSPINNVSKSWKVIYGPRDNHKEHRKKQNKEEKKEEEQQEQDPDIELNCIELTKISMLIIKNDPNVFEIFTSPLQYFVDNKQMIDSFRQIIYQTYNWYKLAIHYIGWSNGNYKQLTHSKKKRMTKKPLKMLGKFIHLILYKYTLFVILCYFE